MRRPQLWGLAAVAVLSVALSLPTTIRAAIAWSLVATPVSATVGVSTTFRLTARHQDPLTQLGCIRVSVTTRFQVEGASITSVSNGRPWRTGLTNVGVGTVVTVQSTTGGGRLDFLGSVTFTVQARPVDPGTWSWIATGYRAQNCRGSSLGVNVVNIVVLSQAPTPGPRPTPAPTARPTATPSPPPTAPPTPTPPAAASPSVSVTATPAPVGSAGAASGSGTSAAPRPSPGSRSPASAPGGAADGGGSTARPDGAAASAGPSLSQPRGTGALLSVALPSGSGGSLDLGTISLGASLGLWSVPAAAIGGPGLLVVLWVALQTAGGMAWLPGRRWMLGEERRRGPRPG
ncbi:MAG: hypothetical protein ACR2KI_08110 [Candidatus Limnocylindria bacterium]